MKYFKLTIFMRNESFEKVYEISTTSRTRVKYIVYYFVLVSTEVDPKLGNISYYSNPENLIFAIIKKKKFGK